MLSGSMYYESAHIRRLFLPGSALFTGSGERFACENSGVDDQSTLVLEYSAENFERLAADAGCDIDFERLGQRFLSLPPTSTALITEARQRLMTNSEARWDELALELTGQVVRGLGSRRSKLAVSARDERKIASTVRYIEAEFPNEMSLLQLAELVQLSPFHFLRTFRDIVGMTPHQYLIRTRLHAAAIRLRRTNEPITSVALDVGFGDLSNFNRTFRSVFGSTPTQYRLRNF